MNISEFYQSSLYIIYNIELDHHYYCLTTMSLLAQGAVQIKNSDISSISSMHQISITAIDSIRVFLGHFIWTYF